MTEDPYRWLEAIANRREYIRSQLTGGSPVLAASLADGILLFGVGTGQSKVFEVFDRQALAGLGHPADLERLRQSIIDAAHLEAFARAPEDVVLRRLVSQGLGPQLKSAFEQIFAPPFLARLLLAEVGPERERDVLVKLGFDGAFELRPGGIAVAADHPEKEGPAEDRLRERLGASDSVPQAATALFREWHRLQASSGTGSTPDPEPAKIAVSELLAGLKDRVVEACLLRRAPDRTARFESLDAVRLGFAPPPSTPPSA